MKSKILILLFILVGVLSGCQNGAGGVTLTEDRTDSLKNVKFEIVNEMADKEIYYEVEGSGLGSKSGIIEANSSKEIGKIMDSTLSGLYLKKLKIYEGKEKTEVYSYDINKNEKDIIRIEEEEKAVFKMTEDKKRK